MTETLPITSIRIGDRHRKELHNIEDLAQSIADVGLLHPVVVTPDGELVAGQRRLAAVTKLGWASVPVTVVDIDEILLGEYAENTYREDFTPTEAVSIGRALENRLSTPVGRPPAETPVNYRSLPGGDTITPRARGELALW